MTPDSVQTVRVSAQVVCRRRGVVIRKAPLTYNIDPDATEHDFKPAHDDWPAQARIHYRIWAPDLRRYDWRVALVALDSITTLD